LEKEIQYINKQLYIQYGYVSSVTSSSSSLDQIQKLDLDYLKKVFEDNERLRLEMDKLVDNIQHSRNDIQRLASTS